MNRFTGFLGAVAMTAGLLLSACDQGADKPIEANIDASSESSSDTSSDTSSLAMTVYKSPTCGCCASWVTYLEEEGFTVHAIDHDDVDSVKARLGLPSPELKSCHTAVIDGYLVEGHVPADDIKRLLRERPAEIKGLSAPGMPMMSPGMASRTPKDYAVLSFTESGDVEVFSQY